jgi:hypothetical protein
MNLSKSLALVLALSLSGAAFAQTPPSGPADGPPRDPWGDGDVTRAESLAKAGEMFDHIDTNHDGVIREAEEEAAVAAGGPGGRMIGFALQRADADGDGKLSRQEFLTSQGERFDRQDADKDGKLTKAERDAAREQMRQRRGPGGPGGGAGPGGGFGPPSGGE